MPIHDWTRVHAGIFHDFHHEWISTIRRAFNSGLLPPEYYALAEQQAAGFGPDVLTLQAVEGTGNGSGIESSTATVPTQPKTRFVFETDAEFYRRRKSSVVVRHISGDRIVAIVEIVSPENKASRHAFRAFVDKACEFLENRIHLLIIDLFPPTKRDPHGIHDAIWQEVKDEPFSFSADKPLTLASYQCGSITRAYVEPVAVNQILPSMPLFIEAENHVQVPLEATYNDAFSAAPRRWQNVLEPT